MMKLAKRMNGVAVMGAIIFMIIQVVSDLYLPNLTADIIDNGIATGDVEYIISVGVKMLGFSLLSVAAATGNVLLASQQSQLLGKMFEVVSLKKYPIFQMMPLMELELLRSLREQQMTLYKFKWSL